MPASHRTEVPRVLAKWRLYFFMVVLLVSVALNIWSYRELFIPYQLELLPFHPVNVPSTTDRHDTNTRRAELDEEVHPVEATETCLEWNNSEAWLNATRLGNEDAGMTHDFVKSMLLNYQSELVGDMTPVAMHQTLCHERSRFMKWSAFDSHGPIADDDIKTKETWTLRLLYLAIHHHQHWPAVRDARARFSCKSNMERLQTLSRTSVGKYDFECPDAKFLVVSPASFGLGATIRLQAMTVMILGIMTDRVVVVVNGAFAGPQILQDPWLLASCDRHDMQCFFLPMSPCVLTEADLESARVLNEFQTTNAVRNMNFPRRFRNDRVIVIEPIGPTYHSKPPPALHLKLLTSAKDILHQAQEESLGVNSSSNWNDILEAASNITNDPNTEMFPYTRTPATEVNSLKAALYYMLRPNLGYQEKIKSEMERIVQPQFDPEMSLGLPIRSTDKCGCESECLSFDEHMALAESMWQGGIWQDPLVSPGRVIQEQHKKVSIILTTESSEVMDKYAPYAQNSSFPFSFLTNDHDAMQGSGNPADYNTSGKAADDIMLSTILALKMQLLAKQTVANCCSNFLNIVFDYLRGGCGLVEHGTAQCLEHHPDSRFRLCCRWTKTPECKAKIWTKPWWG